MLVLFPGVKLLRYGIKNTPKSSAVFKNELIYKPTPHLCLQWHDMGRPLPLYNEGIINNPNPFISTNLSENPKGLQDWICRISKSVGFRQTPRASRSTVKNPKYQKTVKNVQCELLSPLKRKNFREKFKILRYGVALRRLNFVCEMDNTLVLCKMFKTV